jgi:WD40 repeat protein
VSSRKLLWKIDGVAPSLLKGRFLNKHRGQIFCLAVSSDGKYLASGGRDRLIIIWDVHSKEFLKSFKHHKGAVTVVAMLIAGSAFPPWYKPAVFGIAGQDPRCMEH